MTKMNISKSSDKYLILPCGCGGKVGSYAAVKYHPRLNLLDGLIRYDICCTRCEKVATTKK